MNATTLCFVAELMLAIAPLELSAADDHHQKFPATGQTTCYDSTGNVIACAGTGQDGDIQAGTTLRYRDNRNGTITDKNTGLVREKTSASTTRTIAILGTRPSRYMSRP
jgi:hypothetical protein